MVADGATSRQQAAAPVAAGISDALDTNLHQVISGQDMHEKKVVVDGAISRQQSVIPVAASASDALDANLPQVISVQDMHEQKVMLGRPNLQIGDRVKVIAGEHCGLEGVLQVCGSESGWVHPSGVGEKSSINRRGCKAKCVVLEHQEMFFPCEN